MKLLITILICFLATSAFCQKGSVKGILIDTSIHQPVVGATITLLQQKDSSLVSFTMSDDNGRFEMENVSNGNYRLLVTHSNYHIRKIPFLMEAGNDKDLNNVVMQHKSVTLSEVVINSEAPPVSMIGDTIEYNAGSFKTVPNASVEDLLKKLPGVRVEKDGTVKAQGENVNRVLVDGKEFFGNDPKMATKNLPADAVDKVQVYDKMSDQAEMTGFDDGNSEKTINLKLKKDRKKGMFGKATAGYGNDERYQSKFNLNSFKGARQMSVLGMANNINAEGFSFMDMLNFTGALNNMKNNNGNISINIGPDDPLAGLLGGNNSGINNTIAGGVNYNNIIGNKTDWQSNYFYSKYNPLRETETKRQYFSPALFTDQRSITDNTSSTHRLNFSADHHLDSFHSIKLSVNSALQDSKNSSIMNYSTSSLNNKVNDGGNISQSEKEGHTLTANLLFRKKFIRKGRTFSINFTGTNNSSDGTGSMSSVAQLYDANGNIINVNEVNQQSNSAAKRTGSSVRAVYTEPLFKRSLLEFTVGKSTSSSSSSKATYDYDPASDKYDIPNLALTNDFQSKYGYTYGGLKLRKKVKQITYAIGASLQEAELSGNMRNVKDSVISRKFTDILPNARVQYSISRSKNITFNYVTSTNEPSITQLQPVADNSNPLYIPVGNPSLKQEYIHSLQLRGAYNNPFKNRNMFINLGAQLTRDKIESSENINSVGVDSVMPVNVNGVYNMYANVSYSFPVRAIKGSVELGARVSNSQNKRYLNGKENKLKSFDFRPEATLYLTPTEKLDLSIGAGYTYTRTKYSLQPDHVTFLQQDYSMDLNWQPAKKLYFNTDFTYRIVDNEVAGFSSKIPVWNASISRQFLAVNRGQLKLSVNDILNRNVQVNRTANSAYFEDRSVMGLRRYAMLSFTYNLTKVGLGGGSGGVRIMR